MACGYELVLIWAATAIATVTFPLWESDSEKRRKGRERVQGRESSREKGRCDGARTRG